MEQPTTNERPRLRLWPGVAIVALQWLFRFGLPIVVPEAAMVGVLAVAVGWLALAVWWLFFSRAAWSDRWLGLVAMVGVLFAVRPLLDESVRTGGMGVLFFIYALPVVSLAFVLWASSTRHLAAMPRRVAMLVLLVVAAGSWSLVRTGGITGEGESDFDWRWAATPEERLVAESAGRHSAGIAASSGSNARSWPGFRGPRRNGVIRGQEIAIDWSRTPPVELWRRPVGPGWSSFAVDGRWIYTQEQRGDDEVVTCYDATTGEVVWQHADLARFWESNAGAGPRATPTLSDGRVYTFGATGILNVLEAADGAVVWSRDVANESGVETPTWGFAGSPLVVDDLVIAAAAGQLVAYDRRTGEPRWSGPARGSGYSSPQLMTLDGVSQLILLGAEGVVSVVPADGSVLWEHPWPGYPIVQPAVTADGDLLLSVSQTSGTRRLAVRRDSEGWSAEERWTSRGLKPYFSDLVVHGDHAFGFDGSLLACIDLEDGTRQWKGGRYGHGQLVLLPAQDLLLVLSEKGDLALVAADPAGFREIARMPAIEGKTWNHPVLVGDLLLVRNGEEMVAFRMPAA